MFENEDLKREIARLRSESTARTAPQQKSLEEQYAQERAFEQKQKDEAKAKAQLEKWNALQGSLHQSQHYVAEHQAKVAQWQASVASTQKQIDDLLADGFILPAPEAPKVAVAEPKPALPVFPDLSPRDTFADLGFKRVEYIDCPNDCGQRIPPGIAFHRLPEYGVCVLDATRTRGAGVTQEAVDDFYERQRVAAANREEK